MRARSTASRARRADRLEAAVLAPVRAFRLAYLPLLMVYFAYGALGITTVADSFWVKKALTLEPDELAALSVWLTLPWTVKMVFGELVDTVPVAGSQRRFYLFLGAGLVATGLLLLAGAAGQWITVASPDVIYVLAQLLTVTGVVLQDVVADAMSTEVVPRRLPDGSLRDPDEVRRDLGMVQVLGRLALSLGIFAVAGLSGYLAQVLSYETVFLLALAVPAVSVTGAILVRLETSERRPTDWRILGGGLAFGLAVTLLGITNVPFNQEIVFIVSMTVVILMLRRVTAEVAAETRTRIFYAAVLIFAFRAAPSVGAGYQWFTIDRLGFDEAFFGVLAQIGAGIGLVAAWLLSDAITRQPVARVMLWLTILGGVLAVPNLILVHELHQWSEPTLGIGARTIAILDAAAQSPLVQVSMIPLLTLIAIYAPEGHRATWFALMASLMNLALVAGQLLTKYLNILFAVSRGSYDALPALTWTAVLIGLLVPLAVILRFGPRIR
jgi:MFS family permease